MNPVHNTPSIPTDAHASHSRTTSASVVDGHSAHGTDSRRAANTDSSAALRRRYGRSDSQNRVAGGARIVSPPLAPEASVKVTGTTVPWRPPAQGTVGRPAK
ncbi:hypothetical protein [Streptomyces sp. NBC_00576]|uniref:hypothetical protein n=1 Tax=Streptomyces sp. NBC_00576 TaxID=2903665 RepID=UPI002E810C58|nr:hypothetical protein [Streptomyces sp. NBC_00576]WUB76931.1 hypothetical protein OG734_46695 [Streptomyces sp. NBC_00576]